MSNKVPQLRFNGYSDAWVQRKLTDGYKKIRNAFVGTATPFYVETGHFYLESNNVKNGQLNFNSKVFINDEFYQKQTGLLLNTGDLVMVQSGHVGHTAVIPQELDGTAAHALIMFKNNDGSFDSDFVNQYFQTKRARNAISIITTGNTIKHILASDMQKFEVTVPSVDEQKRIANLLESMDNLIAANQRKLDLLKEQKKGYLQKMFPKNGAKVPELRFAGFADDWEERKLENIAQINKGIQRGKQEISSVRNELNPYPVYNGGKKASGYTDECNRENSVMVSEGGASAGYVNYYSGKYWSGGHNFTISNDTKHDTFFLLYVLQNSQEKLYKLQVGTGLPNIQLKSIKDFPIYSTSNTEQQKIGSFFKQLDDTIALHQRKLDLLKEQKKGFLQKMFV